MNALFEYTLFFFQILILSIFISGCGLLLKKAIFNGDKNESFEENGLYGFIFISFISIFINFFFPLSTLVNTVVFILLVLIMVKCGFFNQSKIKLIKYALLVSLLSFILIIHANVNNPDALLYHLPYSKIINENKVIIGIANVDHRFAHISIFQYISSFFNNVFFKEKGLLIPISVLTSFFLIYLYKQYNSLFKNKICRANSYAIFLILIISIYSFSRYSNFGNDAQVHIYYFLLITLIFKYNFDYKDNLFLKKISVIALFTLLLKPFYVFSLIIPFVILLLNKNYNIFFRSMFFAFSLLLSIMWFFKNLLVSGCLIYPVEFTCNKKIFWTSQDIEMQGLLGEAMSKDWQNKINETISLRGYISNFEWVYTWTQNHFNVIIEKIIPVLLFLILNIFFLYLFNFFEKKILKKINLLQWLLLFSTFTGCLIWFLKFPIYRYGYSYLYSFLIILFYIFILNKLNLEKLLTIKKYLNILIIISLFGFIFKNLNRINNKINDPIIPHLFDNINHKNLSKRIFNNSGVFTHFIKIDGSLCGYSPSPCSNKNKSINLKKKYGYSLYYIK